MRRVKPDMEYYVFIGGGVEDNESTRKAMIREIKEEVCLKPKIDKLLFKIENQGRQEYYYLITKFLGKAKLGGEEKQRMNKNNQYYPIWIDLNKISNMDNLYPREARERVVNFSKF